ncbi:PAS domain-containing sensor histidine kinase [Sulfitobacter sp. MF3-043]|uniref:PAS domain-containing sensor histidine kinase n=1 Tax=Sulfitobacter sediminivivens TaxID=3252902 RepID=UPI0036DA267D
MQAQPQANSDITLPAPPVADFEALAFLEQVVSLVPGIIYVFNHKKMANEYSNRSIATLLGYSSQEIIDMGDGMLERVIHPDDIDGLIRYFNSLAMLKDGKTAQYEYRANARNGAMVWLVNNDAVFQRAADGSVVRHIGCASDITEQKIRSLELSCLNATLEKRIAERTRELADLNQSLEATVENRTAELMRTNDELEQLTYIATHDLKVPISNLSHLAEMLEEDGPELTADQGGLVGMMKTSCLQASDKLDSLVRVARARSADLSPVIAIDLAEFATSACDVLKHTVEQLNAIVMMDFDAAPTIQYPPFETSSMLENLIGNALKYAHPDRTPTVHLRSWEIPGAVCVSVRDNGTGLNLPHDEDKVFGLFKRAHVDPPGSGIALFTIRKSIQRYGGAIRIDSVLGEWTKFTLTFPRKVVP